MSCTQILRVTTVAFLTRSNVAPPGTSPVHPIRRLCADWLLAQLSPDSTDTVDWAGSADAPEWILGEDFHQPPRSTVMRVQRIMTKEVRFCHPDDALAEAARMMWEGDVGCLPVTDAEGRVTSVITDRDIAMAAYISGRTLQDQKVSGAMSKRLVTVLEEDETGKLEDAMRTAQVHRLPVVNAAGYLRGMITLNDLAHHRREKATGEGVSSDEVASTLAAVSAPRTANISPRVAA
jgi:CBS domain-containing protein